MTVDVTTIRGDQAAAAWSETEQGPAISGVGDHAMREPGSAILSAISGSIFCNGDINDPLAEHYFGLATPRTNSNIPDDFANTFAQKVGAGCNKVFAAQ